MLENITLPNLKDDAVPRLLLKWQHAMGAFEAPESDCEDSVEVHSMHLGFAKPLLAAAMDEMSHDSLSQAEKPIVEAIVGYMDAFCKIVSAKSVKKILQDPGKSWPIEKLLMPEHMAAGSAFKAVAVKKKSWRFSIRAVEARPLRDLCQFAPVQDRQGSSSRYLGNAV